MKITCQHGEPINFSHSSFKRRDVHYSSWTGCSDDPTVFHCGESQGINYSGERPLQQIAGSLVPWRGLEVGLPPAVRVEVGGSSGDGDHPWRAAQLRQSAEHPPVRAVMP